MMIAKKMMPTYCAKVLKYEQGKIDLQFFFIFAANDVVEHHGKIIEFLQGGGCTYEG